MASTRLEKIGNIFTRVQGLMKSGAMKLEDRPIFYEIYKAFPPLRQPKYSDKVDPNIVIKPLFYGEDQQRASRDDSNTLFNLNETSKRVSGFEKQPVTFSSPPQEKQKIFDMNELTDLKQ